MVLSLSFSHNPMAASSSTQYDLLEKFTEKVIHALQPIQTTLVSLASKHSTISTPNPRSVNMNHIPDLMTTNTKHQMQFPRFGGGDPSEWLYQAEQYFRIHNISETQKLMFASFHLDGAASSWFQWMTMTNQVTSWTTFVIALTKQFGPYSYADPIEALTCLVQKSSVPESQWGFQRLCCTTENNKHCKGPSVLDPCEYTNDDIEADDICIRAESVQGGESSDSASEELMTRACMSFPTSVTEAFRVDSMVEVAFKESTKLCDKMSLHNILTTHVSIGDEDSKTDDNKGACFSEYTLASTFFNPNDEVYAPSIHTQIEYFIFANIVCLPFDESKGLVKHVLRPVGTNIDWWFAVGISGLRVLQFYEESIGNFKPYQDYMVFHKWRDNVELIFRDLVTTSLILRALLHGNTEIFHKGNDRGVVLHGCWMTALLVTLNFPMTWFDCVWVDVLLLWVLLQKGADSNEDLLSIDYLAFLRWPTELMMCSSKSTFIIGLLNLAAVNGYQRKSYVFDFDIMLQDGHGSLFEEAKSVFEELRSAGCKPNMCTFDELIKMHGNQGKFTEIMKVFEEIINCQCTPDIITWSTLLEVFDQTGMDSEVSGVFKDLKRAGFVPERDTFNTLISAYSRGGSLAQAMVVYKRMLEAKVIPDLSNYNIVLAALARGGQWQQAEKVLTEMMDGRSETNELTYCSLLHAYAKGKEIVWMGALFAEIYAGAIESPAVFLKTLVLVNNKRDLLIETERAFLELRQRGFSPDITTFNAMVSIHGRRHVIPKPNEIINVMKESGFTPSLATYNSLLYIYSQYENFTRAEDVLKEIVKKRIKPDNISVIYAFCRDDRMREASRVSEIREIGCIHDEETPYHLTSTMGTCCYSDPAYQQLEKLCTKSEFQTTDMEWLSLSMDGFSVFIIGDIWKVGIQQVHGIDVGDVLNFHKWKERVVLIGGWLMIAEAARSEWAAITGDLQSISWLSMAFGGKCGSLFGGYQVSSLQTETILLIFSLLPTIQLISCGLVIESRVVGAPSAAHDSKGSNLLNGHGSGSEEHNVFNEDPSKSTLRRKKGPDLGTNVLPKLAGLRQLTQTRKTLQVLVQWKMWLEEEENELNATDYEQLPNVVHHEDMVSLEGWSNDTARHRARGSRGQGIIHNRMTEHVPQSLGDCNVAQGNRRTMADGIKGQTTC